MAAMIEILDAQGNVLAPIKIGNLMPGITELVGIKFKNIGDTTSEDILLSVACSDWGFSGRTNKQGQEVVTRQFVEVNAGLWTPIGGDFSDAGHYHNLGPLAADAEVVVSLRMNVPTDAQTRGSVSFILVGSM